MVGGRGSLNHPHFVVRRDGSLNVEIDTTKTGTIYRTPNIPAEVDVNTNFGILILIHIMGPIQNPSVARGTHYVLR